MKSLAAALTLFTRLPLWKWIDIPVEAYSSTVVFWPLTGWITGSLAACVILCLSHFVPVLPALIIAIIGQLCLTGALHEDGLADFCDGFGGGRDKESVLSIMKDSHIGTYGVIGLICYYLLLVSLLSSLSPFMIALTVFAADPFSKFCASQIINLLPYARKEGAKNKISYQKMTVLHFAINLLSGCLPVIPLLVYFPGASIAVVFPLLSIILLILYMKHRLGGYTGDCCGASFLICEVSMIFGVVFSLSL